MLGLKVQKSKVVEKWYVDQQMDGFEQSVRSLITTYNLNKRTLSDHKRKYKYHLRTCVESGRPKYLDEEAQLAIIREVRHNPNTAEPQLRQLIRCKHRDCWNKWHIGNPIKVFKNVSVRTVVRYSILLRDKAAFPG